jgi:hypothetical protein
VGLDVGAGDVHRDSGLERLTTSLSTKCTSKRTFPIVLKWEKNFAKQNNCTVDGVVEINIYYVSFLGK